MRQKILIGLLGLALIGVVAVAYSYLSWRGEQMRALHSGSQLAETSLGAVEYVLRGSDGPVILSLHGSPGGYDQAPLENREGYRLLAPSRPGYLATPLEVGRTPAQQAQAYAALLDVLGIQEVIVMGASGGGPSAIAFSAMYPERTTGLILLEAVSQPISNDGEISALMSSDFLYWIMMSVMLGTGGPEALAASTVPDETNQQLILKDPGKLADLERIAWSLWPPSERLAGWRNDMEQMNELALPGQVRVPTLIIHGTKDADVPFDQSVNLADAIEGAQLYAVEGGDHMMPISHREEVTSVIDDFLTSLVE